MPTRHRAYATAATTDHQRRELSRLRRAEDASVPPGWSRSAFDRSVRRRPRGRCVDIHDVRAAVVLGARKDLSAATTAAGPRKGLAPILSWKKRRFGCYRGPRGGQKYTGARFPGVTRVASVSRDTSLASRACFVTPRERARARRWWHLERAFLGGSIILIIGRRAASPQRRSPRHALSPRRPLPAPPRPRQPSRPPRSDRPRRICVRYSR